MAAPSSRLPPPPPQDDVEEDGASPNERLLLAAKQDNEELLEAALSHPKVDVNHQDGLGNTALHWSITNASTRCLEPLLEAEGCDVDIQNRLEGDTPLHIAVRNRWEEQDGLQLFLVESMLEAGADPLVKNKRGLRAIDLLPAAGQNPEVPEEQVRQALRRSEAELAIGAEGDVVNGELWISTGLKPDDDDIIDPNDVASDSD